MKPWDAWFQNMRVKKTKLEYVLKTHYIHYV